MNRIEHYLKPAPRYVALSWLLLMASTMLAVWSGVELYRQYQNLLKREEEVAVLRRISKRPPPPKPSRADIEQERHWNTLRHELNFSWYPLFAALERTSNPNIALLEFLPDKTTGHLTLRGTARDMESLTAYLASLSDEKVFHNVYLSHQKKLIQTNVEVVSFEIRMQLMRS